MYMAQNSSGKHFLGSDSGERYRGPCVHIEPVFSRGKSGHNTTILHSARWSDTSKAPRMICSTRISVYYYWQQWTALTSPCLLAIAEACLVVGTCQVQCVELGAEAPSVGGIPQDHFAVQFPAKCGHSEILLFPAYICPVASLPLPVLAARSGRGKQKDGWLNIRAALYCGGRVQRV